MKLYANDVNKMTNDTSAKWPGTLGKGKKGKRKIQNGDLREDASSGHEIHDFARYALWDVEIDVIDKVFILQKKKGSNNNEMHVDRGLFCVFVDLNNVKVHKNEIKQQDSYPAILTKQAY